jgi:hypothetical protein
MGRSVVVTVAALVVTTAALSGSAAAATKPRNCAASVAKSCTPPTKAQIRAVRAARSDAESACTQVNLLVAQTHLNQTVDPSSLTAAIDRLSRTRQHGPLAPVKLLRDAKRTGYASEELVSLTALQAWCGGLGAPA